MKYNGRNRGTWPAPSPHKFNRFLEKWLVAETLTTIMASEDTTNLVQEVHELLEDLDELVNELVSTLVNVLDSIGKETNAGGRLPALKEAEPEGPLLPQLVRSESVLLPGARLPQLPKSSNPMSPRSGRDLESLPTTALALVT